MVLPVNDQALQQVWPTQEGAVNGGRATQGNMVAATGTGVAAIKHKLLGPEAHLAGLLVKVFGNLHQLVPVVGGMYIHLNHTRVRGHLQDLDPRVRRRLITLNDHRHGQRCRRGFYLCQQSGVGFQAGLGRHKDIQVSLPDLHTEGRMHNFLRLRRAEFGQWRTHRRKWVPLGIKLHRIRQLPGQGI